jgi:hypothetical protein
VSFRHPNFIARVGDEQPGDAAAHTVADDNHPFAQWKLSLSGIELLAEDCRGVRIWVTARVAVKPELVMTPDALVTTQVVDQIASQFPLRISYKLLRPEKPIIKGGIFGPNYG